MNGRNALRTAGKLAVGTLVLTLVVVLGLLAWTRTARPQLDGEIEVPGLRTEVQVVRDSMGVPHIFADNEHDLHFAQGYVHAQDRLWQMELVRRVAQGRLAEVLGPGLVDSDRFLRTLGLWRAAGDQETALPADAMALLDAYVAGVNAFLATRRGALPPEFLALGFQPEPWTRRHSLAVEKVMAWDLALYGDAAEASRAVSRIGPDAVQSILGAAYPEWGPTIVESAVPPAIPEAAAALLDALSTTRASNAWVIGGTLTRSGKPIVANDMHLVLRAPSLWYLAAHHTGTNDVAGMTLPGLPFIIAGHNRAVAWGFTNASLDDLDFFRIRTDSADPARYLTPQGSARFRVAAETIQVKNGQPVVLHVRLTRHGPIMSLDETSDELIALRWAAHDPSRSYEAFPLFNRARSVDELLAAIPWFDNPHQNVVFADTAGRFGYAMGGRIPRRGTGRPPPTLPVPGWTDEWEWTGYFPFDEAHPVVLDPQQGYVVTANNRQAPDAQADRISGDWEMPFRAARIREMIRAGGPFDAAAVHRMQLDVRDALAERYIARALEAARAAGNASAVAALEAWNLEATIDSHAAALFYVWYERLRAGLRRGLYGTEQGWLPREAVNAALDAGAIPWAPDTIAQESIGELATRAFIEADSIVVGRAWGELHRAAAEHALAPSDLLRRLFRLNVGPDPAPGASTTVNVSHFNGTQFPAAVTAGASQRHVVDLGNIDGAGGFILPTGQSGIPFDARYRDQWRMWLEGGLRPIPLEPARAHAQAQHRLRLRPRVTPEP